MVTLTCYVADCNLSDAGTPPPTITDLTPNGRPLGSYFQQASGVAQLNIALDWSRRNILRPFQQTGSVGNDELLHLSPQVLGSNEASNPPSIGLLFCDSYAPACGQYGLMFDIDRQDGSSGQRQGCAVFLRAIWNRFFTELPATADPAFREAVGYISVHELGHALNLWHVGNTSFMQAHPAPEQLGSYDFDANQQSYLALAAAPATAGYVLPGPGQEPFGTLAPGFSSGDDSPFAGPPDAASGLDLQIALSQATFWTFEPVELDVELYLPPDAPTAMAIPDELDPGYRSFQIWITQPNGERFRYRPQTRFCQANGQRNIAPGQSFRRDIAIGRQSGGFTFIAAGQYRIQAVFRLESGDFVFSNIAACEVLPADHASSGWIATSGLMQSPAAQRLLRFKNWVPSYYDCARLASFADQAASPETANAINYALGKAMLRQASTIPHGDYANDLRRRGAAHLRRALDTQRLSSHRTQIATALLQSLKEATI